MKIVAIIQARMGSSRFPEKTLKDLNGLPVLDWVVRAGREISGVAKVIVATSKDPADDMISQHCKNNQIDCYRGDLNDVLSRYYHAALEQKADVVIRLTADCPFLDPKICSTILRLFQTLKVDYASNTLVPSWPDGLDCEIFTFKALEKSYKEATLKSHREHVTQYIHHNRTMFKVHNLNCPLPDIHGERWTLDYVEDYQFLKSVAQLLPTDTPPSYLSILDILDKNPKLKELNTNIIRNDGLIKSKKEDAANPIAKEFKKSKELLERAEKTIPLGSQTFSKSKTQYPVGYGPLYVTHGLGSHIWDVDGNEYVDMVNALLPNVLGYADPDVDFAIRNQLNSGISLSLATNLEVELAEKLVSLIPCAESVRFGKNGTDATSGCIRVARAHTGRDRVIVCGYHGWQDWYIGSTTRNKGVPEGTQSLTHSVPYNNLQAVEDLLKKYPNEFACLIMEPMNFIEPEKNYLSDLKKLLHKYDTLLVFDEVITGFRYALGGAQEYFDVVPDLASFGKSMGNGMPISAVVGRKDIMKQMEEIFFSSTFGGETLSLAASLAVIKKMEKLSVIEKLWSTGKKITEGVNNLIQKYELTSVIELKGKDPWRLLSLQAYKDEPVEVIKTLLLYELHKNGVLTLGSHNICFAHSAADIDAVVNSYDKAFLKLREELSKGKIIERLEPPVIKPLFKVR
jgi:glutamate-1-semialdehyde 2,1-aminomutase